MNVSLARSLPYKGLLAAVASLLVAGCGAGGPQKTVGRCDDKSCDAPLACDPGDGICKCGGPGGVICEAGGVCDPEAHACTYPACKDVTCTGGTTCDGLDGQCKCGGQGGPSCKADEVCDPAARACVASNRCVGVTCASGTACDPADGVCKCGGNVCKGFEVCKANACVANPCNGVTCTGGTVCNPTDGSCRCGGTDGATCGSSQTCECPGSGPCDDADRRCTGSALCANVQCQGGTTCDPADGRCRCGGPGGRECSAGQTCDVLNRVCLGGNRCAGVTCSGGLTCDPEDGLCKCGGLNGQICQPKQVCAGFSSGARCVNSCDPRRQDCPAGQGCYFDTDAKTAYCAANGTKGEGQSCATSPDCNVGFHCQPQAFTAGMCRRYCDVSSGATGCPQSPTAQSCVALTGASAGLGACQ